MMPFIMLNTTTVTTIQPPQAGRWLTEMGNPFAAVGLDESGRVGIDWGVYGVPETYVVRPDGVVAFKFIGPLSPTSLKGELSAEIDKALAATTRRAAGMTPTP